MGIPKLTLVESREDIKPRPSLLNPDMPVSVNPAPDILGLWKLLILELAIFQQYCHLTRL